MAVLMIIEKVIQSHVQQEIQRFYSTCDYSTYSQMKER